MRIEQHIVASWAAKLSKQLVSEVIRSLERMEATLSGDCSGLKNVWEEICAQVQREESFFWGAYENVLNDLIVSTVSRWDHDAQLTLWAVTDSGWDFIYDYHSDRMDSADVPLNIDDIVSKLKKDVLSAAADYESASLYRYIWGEDDPQYDEEYEEDEDDKETNLEKPSSALDI